MADKVGGLIERTLKPLVEEREGLLEEYTQLKQAADEKQAEIKTVEKLLRAGGLLEPVASTAKQTRNSRPIRVSDRSLNLAIEALPKMPPTPFTVKEFSEVSGLDINTGKKALETLHREGKLRFAGQRVPEGASRNYKAMHWALI